MAYKVYYGKLTDGPIHDDGWGYMWVNRTLIYDSSTPDDNDYLIDPVLTREVNQAGSFEADVPKSHSCINNLELFTGVIDIERDGEVIWQGRIKTIETDFNLNKHIYCEGDLAYLNDVYVKIDWSSVKSEIKDEDAPTGLYFYNWGKFFEDYCKCATSEGKGIISKITYGNDDQESGGIFDDAIDSIIGAVSSFLLGVQFTGSVTFADDTVYMSAWDAFQNTLIDGILSKIKDNVYFVMKHEKMSNGLAWYRGLYPCVFYEHGDGLTPSDNFRWGESLMPVTQQTIEFGKNLTDIRISRGVNEDLVTQCEAYGYETKGWWIFKNTNEISGIYQDSELVSKYGIVEKKISVDGVSSTNASLINVAKSVTTPKDTVEYEEVEVSAVDLYDIDEAPDRLDFLKITRVISEPHGIDRYLVCTKLVEPLDDPSGKQFTYGRKHSTISSSQSSIGTISQRGFDMSKATKNYIADS